MLGPGLPWSEVTTNPWGDAAGRAEGPSSCRTGLAGRPAWLQKAEGQVGSTRWEV